MATESIVSQIQARLNGRFLLSVPGIFLAALVSTTVINPPKALLFGIVLAVVRYILPMPFSFALGQLMLVGLFPTSTSLSQFAGTEAGLFVMLIGPALLDEAPIRMLGATLTALIGLGAISWGVLQSTDTLWLVGFALVGSTALVAYGLHRYERVRLGLVQTS